MSQLAPVLFDRRFEALLDIARGRLPALAPDWTDYNLHDPGITLIELLAWVAEAQLYSLSRMRRDERLAYAALFGLAPHGPQPATGLLWPDPADANAPAASYTRSMVLAPGTLAHTDQSETPAYRTLRKYLWLAGRIAALRTAGAGGCTLDHTATNERGHVAYLPFGPRAGARDVLAIDIACPPDGGLLPPRVADADGALLCIGVRADGAPFDPTLACADATPGVTLVFGRERIPLKVANDSTCGFMRTGVIELELAGVDQSPRAFTLEFRSAHGFARPPRVTRIALNVLPIRQGRAIERELHVASGLPGQVLELAGNGLEFQAGAEPVEVEVVEGGEIGSWSRRPRLEDSDPDDRVYALDPARATIRFGNGVNGRAPAAGAQVLVSYAVCDGAGGNVAPNRRWVVRGIAGIFGVNPDPVTQGAGASDLLEQRRIARARWRDAHPLVTAHDLEQAARGLDALEVARAWALAPPPRLPDTGAVELVAMRARAGGAEPAEAPETARWLAAVERRLASRLPLGTRLQVRGPRYLPFRLAAQVDAEEGYEPAALEAALRTMLAQRMALTAAPGLPPRPLGLGVTQRDLAAWLRQVPGVRRVASLRLASAPGQRPDRVDVPRDGLPKLDLGASTITVRRGAP